MHLLEKEVEGAKVTECQQEDQGNIMLWSRLMQGAGSSHVASHAHQYPQFNDDSGSLLATLFIK